MYDLGKAGIKNLTKPKPAKDTKGDYYLLASPYYEDIKGLPIDLMKDGIDIHTEEVDFPLTYDPVKDAKVYKDLVEKAIKRLEPMMK